MDTNIININAIKDKIIKDNQVNNKYEKESLYLYPDFKIAVVIPAYNEEKNLEKVLSKIPNNLSNKLDLIVVDDGSTDRTGEIAQFYNSVVLKHLINKGNGAATTTGLNYCKKKIYDVVVILDADGQHDPKYIPDFLKAIIRQKNRFVIGNRFKYPYSMNSYKKLCSKIMTAFYFIFLRKKISDPTNGFRALESKVLKNIDFKSSYSITQEMLFKILPYYKYKEIPIKINQRVHGESFIRLKNYFFKMILFFIKYYIFPKISNISKRIFSEDTRRRISLEFLST